MNFTFETQGTNTYLVYKINETDCIDSMSLGMLTNNRIPGIAKTIFTQIDMEKFIKFNVSSKVSVRQFFNGPVSRKRLIGVFRGIVDAIENAEEYMLDPSSLLLDLEYIFTDVSSYETVLICVPLEGYVNDVNIGSFFKNIMFNTQFDQTENCDYVAKIMNYLNSTPRFSADEFKKILEELENVTFVNLQKSVVMAPNNVTQPSVNSTSQNKVFLEKPVTVSVERPIETNKSVLEKAKENVSAEAEKMKSEFMADYARKLQVEGKENKKDSKKSAIPMPPPFVGVVADNGTKKKKEKKKVEKEPKEKKPGLFSGLFKKDENSKSIKSEKKEATLSYAVPGMEVDGIAIPGMSQPVVEAKAQAIPEVKKTIFKKETIATQQPVDNTWENKPSQPSTQPANFGETTVLNASPAIGETTVLIAGAMQMEPMPHIIRSRYNEKVPVNKAVFHIGKERSYVDYCIGDNTAISRSHANIITREGNYFIIDTNSTNHVYVNGQMIPCNQEVQIKDGDKIRLANEDFTFQLM